MQLTSNPLYGANGIWAVSRNKWTRFWPLGKAGLATRTGWLMKKFLDRLFGSGADSRQGPPTQRSVQPALRLSGDGRFHIAVVGESRYLQAFQHIFGPRTSDGIDQECDAHLVLEDDNPFDDHAVRVDIEGRTIGYLSRADARTYRTWLAVKSRANDARCCRALVRGGWDRGGDDVGDYGVSLDLPAEAVPMARTRTPPAGPVRDEHGQPHALVNRSRRVDRSINELLGLTKGVIADDTVSVAEADTLRAWINANPEAADAWPGNVLAERIARIYDDGRVDEAEREELRCLLEDLAGGQVTEQGNVSTRLPLDDPPPELRFDGTVYVFTGRFFSGTRQWCEALVESRGGVCSSNVTRRTKYLVIGELGSRDWKHTSFGRKIQKAVEIRAEGRGLAIIAEDHWARCVRL